MNRPGKKIILKHQDKVQEYIILKTIKKRNKKLHKIAVYMSAGRSGGMYPSDHTITLSNKQLRKKMAR